VAENNGLAERLFDACVRGDRATGRAILERCVGAGYDADGVLREVLWPVYGKVDEQHRADLLSELEFRLATRMLIGFVHVVGVGAASADPVGRTVFVLSGPGEADEIAGQMVSDVLERSGYSVTFAGGGVANDEILERVQRDAPDALVMFASAASDLPRVRSLVDTINEIGALRSTQVVLGGGVFNRASGLAEEVGADLWAEDPFEVVEAMLDEPDRKMDPTQRTVGALTKPKRAAA